MFQVSISVCGEGLKFFGGRDSKLIDEFNESCLYYMCCTVRDLCTFSKYLWIKRRTFIQCYMLSDRLPVKVRVQFLS